MQTAPQMCIAIQHTYMYATHYMYVNTYRHVPHVQIRTHTTHIYICNTLYICMQHTTYMYATHHRHMPHVQICTHVYTQVTTHESYSEECSVLQCVAVCCSVLQRATLCCSVLTLGYMARMCIHNVHMCLHKCAHPRHMTHRLSPVCIYVCIHVYTCIKTSVYICTHKNMSFFCVLNGHIHI